jgi:methionyl-tRNA formyltransferase
VNDPSVREALREYSIDFVLARCKQIIGKKTFSVPHKGVFVLHPGICPEYRNAHGCFWAMAEADFDNVGTTLLKIDEGVDTGPIYAYFRVSVRPPVRESPMVIQQRTLFDNLETVREVMQAALNGSAAPISTVGRKSAVWGQPWYSAWRRFAR